MTAPGSRPGPRRRLRLATVRSMLGLFGVLGPVVVGLAAAVVGPVGAAGTAGAGRSTAGGAARTTTTKLSTGGADPWVAGTGGTLTVGIDQAPTGCNPDTATGDTWADQFVLGAVLPGAFVVGAQGTPTYDSAVITQAEVVSTTPETVVYTINPRAVWSDGRPITAADFAYAWREQRGTGAGAGADVATTQGYRQIESVKGSNHGRTVTVTFKTPYADWRSLFGDLLPSHVLERVGWDPACRTPDRRVDLSGGPFEIGRVEPGREIVLVRNPHWWGTAPDLERIVVRIATGPAQLASWVDRGTAQVVVPTGFGSSFLEQVSAQPAVQSADQVSATFLQLDYSMTSAATSSLAAREGISHAVDRQALLDDVVGAVNAGIVPAASHLYAQSQAGYPGPRSPAGEPSGPSGGTTTTTGGASSTAEPFPLADDPAASDRELAAAGYVRTPGTPGTPAGMWTGPDGKPLVLRLAVDAGDQWAAKAATDVTHQLEAAGIGVTRVTAASATATGMDLADGSADAALLPYQSSPYPSQAIAWYTTLLGTPGQGGSQDWTGFDNPTLDATLTAASEQLNPVDAAPLYQQADTLLWDQMVALPLFAEPSALAWSSYTAGVSPDPYGPGLLWSSGSWALRVPATSPRAAPAG